MTPVAQPTAKLGGDRHLWAMRVCLLVAVATLLAGLVLARDQAHRNLEQSSKQELGLLVDRLEHADPAAIGAQLPFSLQEIGIRGATSVAEPDGSVLVLVSKRSILESRCIAALLLGHGGFVARIFDGSCDRISRSSLTK